MLNTGTIDFGGSGNVAAPSMKPSQSSFAQSTISSDFKPAYGFSTPLSKSSAAFTSSSPISQSGSTLSVPDTTKAVLSIQRAVPEFKLNFNTWMTKHKVVSAGGDSVSSIISPAPSGGVKKPKRKNITRRRASNHCTVKRGPTV